MKPPVPFRIFENSDAACARAVDVLAGMISERAMLGRRLVLGLVAGESSLPFFSELIYRHREEGMSLGNVVTFNTDAYAGLDEGHPASMQSFMRRHLFDHVDIPSDGIHFPPVADDPRELSARCADYEAAIQKAGGVDYQVHRLLKNGNMGMHDPSLPNDGRTRKVAIHDSIREYKAAEFNGLGNVPTHVVSLGYKALLKSRRIVVLAWGARKAYTVRRVILGPVTPGASASCLQGHPDICFYLDAPAGRLIAEKPEDSA